MKNNISTAAALMGSSRTEAKTTAARKNGAKGGRPGRYYALHWICGYGATHADTGEDFVDVYGFGSRIERDAACEGFRAPDHCPNATLEAVQSSNTNVRKAIRSANGCEVMEWDA